MEETAQACPNSSSGMKETSTKEEEGTRGKKWAGGEEWRRFGHLLPPLIIPNYGPPPMLVPGSRGYTAVNKIL